jgi:hypothetical protein
MLLVASIVALNIFRKFRAAHTTKNGFVGARRQVKRNYAKGIVYLG